jgi:uncharacterized protein YlxP (DUF503 family)
MIVGVAAIELQVHGSQSLKEKRGVVQSIGRRLRNRFNVAVAEVGGQDLWQRALLGVTAIGSDAERVRQVLERTIAFTEDLHLAELLRSEIEILRLPYESGEPGPEDPGDLPWEGSSG